MEASRHGCTGSRMGASRLACGLPADHIGHRQIGGGRVAVRSFALFYHAFGCFDIDFSFDCKNRAAMVISPPPVKARTDACAIDVTETLRQQPMQRKGPVTVAAGRMALPAVM
jgi:hypothetical protein